jgi:hypothetical protein
MMIQAPVTERHHMLPLQWREQNGMKQASFSAGQSVRLLKDLRSLKSQPEGLYRIVRLLPEDGHVSPRYRIRHDGEAFERVVSEDQLAEPREETQ